MLLVRMLLAVIFVTIQSMQHVVFRLLHLRPAPSGADIREGCTTTVPPHDYSELPPTHGAMTFHDGVNLAPLRRVLFTPILHLYFSHSLFCVNLSVARSCLASRAGPLLRHLPVRVTCPRRTFHPDRGRWSAAGGLHHPLAPLLCDHW